MRKVKDFEILFSFMLDRAVIDKFSPNLVRLDGHITASHKLAKIRKLNEDISFNAVRIVSNSRSIISIGMHGFILRGLK